MNKDKSDLTSSISEIDMEHALEVLNVNSISPVLVTQKLLPNLKDNGGSTVVMVSSLMGSISDCLSGKSYAYRASKTALNSITKNMSIDLNAIFKTIVFAIDPGNVQSGMNPGGHIKSEVCANLIIDLISTNVQSLNGKFINYNIDINFDAKPIKERLRTPRR